MNTLLFLNLILNIKLLSNCHGCSNVQIHEHFIIHFKFQCARELVSCQKLCFKTPVDDRNTFGLLDLYKYIGLDCCSLSGHAFSSCIDKILVCFLVSYYLSDFNEQHSEAWWFSIGFLDIIIRVHQLLMVGGNLVLSVLSFTKIT